jgi:integrase
VKRKRLFTLGTRGARVIGFHAGALVRVEWREGGKRMTRSWEAKADTKKIARAFALGVQDRLERGGVPDAPATVPTLDALFSAYLLAVRDGLRPRTVALYRQRWAEFVAFAKPERRADTVTPELLDAFRAAVAERHVPNQIKELVRVVKIVFNWGVARGHVPPSRLQLYRFVLGKDAKRIEMAEYSAEEAQALIAHFDPRKSREWRPFVMLTLLAFCGPRQRAARFITWNDVDLDGGRIHWRAATDKVGRDRWQPLPTSVLEALYVAYGWRRGSEADAFIFFSPTHAGRVWTYQAFSYALREAEKAVGIPHRKWRGAHGFRRGVVGNVIELTGGDMRRAASWIGDKSTRIIEAHYALDRDGQMRDVADLLEPEGKA